MKRRIKLKKKKQERKSVKKIRVNRKSKVIIEKEIPGKLNRRNQTTRKGTA